MSELSELNEADIGPSGGEHARRALASLRLTTLGVVALALALALLTRLLAPAPNPANARASSSAPPITLPAEQGGARLPAPVALTGQGARATLVVFFYSLCPHCAASVTAVADLAHERAGAGLRAVFVDSPAESPGIVAAYAERLGVDAPALLDTQGRAASRYGVAYYPATLLLDAQGVVRARWTGEVSAPTLRVAVAPLLASGP